MKYSKNSLIDKDEIEFLERYLLFLVNETKLSDARPLIASKKICKALGLNDESLIINCIASVLDKIDPKKDGFSRQQMVFHVILQSKFLYYS